LPVDLERLAAFIAGYLVVLATPGPNLIAVGGVAALRGLGGAVPLCLGISLGASALGATLLAAVSAASGNAWWDTAGHFIGAVLLVWLAVSVARQKPPEEDTKPGKRGDGMAAFGAGFCTAATNPLTAAFFGSQFLGSLRDHEATTTVVPMVIFFSAMAFFLCLAVLMARPAFRKAALAWHRPIRLMAAGVLILMAMSSLRTIF
jgi:threonine/homoserine/homoserine lactone efflux protein